MKSPILSLFLGLLLGLVTCLLPPTSAFGEIPLDDQGKVKLSGDLRFRLEADRDSVNPAGVPRADRTRARIRARLGLTADVSPKLRLGLRLRSGSRDSQQSPHVTVADFDGNPTGDRDVLLDRWYLRWSGDRTRVTLGRDSFPFWKQNEFFWDDDVTPAGLSVAHHLQGDKADISLRGGFFTLLDGAVDFHGEMAAGQVVVSGKRGTATLTGASGLYVFEGEPGAELLRNGNGARDSTVWVSSFQVSRPVGDAGRPLTLGADAMVNLESYSRDDPDPFTAAHHDETDGFVLSVRWGATKEPGDWLVGYAYARIEALAVHASYAQDDWFRWGSATQTDSSDYWGHELRFGYAFRKDLDLLARLYTAEALTSVQDGNRFRVDLNYRF